MKGVLPDDICINNSTLAVDSPPKLILLVHEKSTGSIPPFGISMPSLKVLLKHILLQHIGMDYLLNRTTQHQDEALTLLIVALYPLPHIFVVVISPPALLVVVCHVCANTDATSCGNQEGPYRRFLPDQHEAGPSIVVILSLLSKGRAVEECSRPKDPLLERGRCSCCVHHRITAVSSRRHLNYRLWTL
eukprot:scaffold11045_cov138-Skeletonema_menzelii.AAC.7